MKYVYGFDILPEYEKQRQGQALKHREFRVVQSLVTDGSSDWCQPLITVWSMQKQRKDS